MLPRKKQCDCGRLLRTAAHRRRTFRAYPTIGKPFLQHQTTPYIFQLLPLLDRFRHFVFPSPSVWAGVSESSSDRLYDSSCSVLWRASSVRFKHMLPFTASLTDKITLGKCLQRWVW